MVTDARVAVAAGALFVDGQGRVMLVRPVYKPYWDIPGGFVASGESPRAACTREIAEELGLHIDVGELLAVDWAPRPPDGDKLLFVFDGGVLSDQQHAAITLQDGELSEYRYVATDELDRYTVPRLVRRVSAAVAARDRRHPAYLEYGCEGSKGR